MNDSRAMPRPSFACGLLRDKSVKNVSIIPFWVMGIGGSVQSGMSMLSVVVAMRVWAFSTTTSSVWSTSVLPLQSLFTLRFHQ